MRRSHQIDRPRRCSSSSVGFLAFSSSMNEVMSEVYGFQNQGMASVGAKREKSKRAGDAGPRAKAIQAATRLRCWPSRRNPCGSPLIQRASSSRRAVPTSKAGKTTLTVSKPSRLATWKVTRAESWSGRTRMLLWKSASELEALLDEAAVLGIADHLAVVVGAALAQPRLELLDLGRKVLGDGDAGAGLGGEAEDDVVEDLRVAQLLHARVGSESR